jgi:hypothetical protein
MSPGLRTIGCSMLDVGCWMLFPPLLWLCLSAAVFSTFSAGAQNFVKNPDFEEPLSTNNWTVVYVYGGPPDFSIQDRTTIAHKDKVPGTWDGEPNYLDVYGAAFQPYHDAMMHAYFKQTVTGLTPYATYVISCWMVQFEALYTNKVQVYMEAVGGPTGTITKTTPNVYAACNNKPTAWAKYAVTNTASGTGQIEVRLHFNKDKFTSLAWEYIRAYYDHAAVMPLVQSPPPFKMLSLSVTNPNAATFSWESVMNNTYDLEAATAFGSWSKFRTDLLAKGTNLTFTTNLSLGPGARQFFRVQSHNYVP